MKAMLITCILKWKVHLEMKGQVKCIASCMCSSVLHILPNIIFLDVTIMARRPNNVFLGIPLLLIFSFISLSGLFYSALQLFLKVQLKSQGYESWSVQAKQHTHTHSHTLSLNTVLCQGLVRDIPLQCFHWELAVAAFFKGGVTVNISYLWQCNIYTPVKCDVYIGLL